MKNLFRCCLLKFLSLAALLFSPSAEAGTAFTYQGRLTENGSSFTGTAEFQPTLWDAASDGTLVMTNNPQSLIVGVTNGLFVLPLDFGANFPGGDRWLQIEVRTTIGSFTVLSPRQPITSTPYAIHAGNAASSDVVTGSISAAQLTGTIAPSLIANGTITSAMLTNGAVTSSALADGAVTAEKLLTVTNWPLFVTFSSPTPKASESFGYSVAAVGTDLVLIGIGKSAQTGAAYLFSVDGTLLVTITNQVPQPGDSFGASAVAVGTDKVLIAAQGDNTGANDAGAAYLFSTNGTLLMTITNPTPRDFDFFGRSLAAVGTDKFLVGAAGDDSATIYPGIAYLFSINGSLLTTITNPTPESNDNFAYSMATVGTDKVIIGAYGDNTGANDAGAAYLFNTDGTLLTTITNPTPQDSDFFGRSVAAVGTNKVLVGADRKDIGASSAGVAYLFSTDGTLLTTITNPTPQANDYFGFSVATVGTDKILIGAYEDDTGATGAGAAYLFSTNGTLLTTIINPSLDDYDGFGISVAAVGADKVLIGAHQDDTGATSAGAAYLFSPDSYAPGLVSERVYAGSVTTVSLANGAVTAEKIGGVLNASQIPNLDASKITSGQLSDSRLSSSVARLYADQTFTGSLHFNPTSLGSPFTVGNSMRVSNLNADLLDGLTASQFSPSSHHHDTVYWKQSGNSGTTAGANFIGTTDNQALEFKVNGTRALRLEPTSSNATVNVIGGSPLNFVSASVVGAVIGGGGSGYSTYSNSIFASHAVIAGGAANSVKGDSDFAVIAGGYFNQIGTNSGKSTIGGGFGNTIIPNSEGAAISGGQANKIMTNSQFSVISGGLGNYIQESSHSIIGGGFDNRIVGATKSAIFSGEENRIERDSNYGTINGGWLNSIGTNSDYASIGGGSHNFILRNSRYATIPGGVDNVATNYAFAAGRWAQAIHTGAFVWADSQSASFSSSGANQFLIRAQGGVGINTSDPSGALEVAVATGKSLQFRHDSGLVPGINVATTGGNAGIMRFRNSMEVWPSDDLTRSARIDLRSTNGSATIVLNGQSGNISCVTLNQTSDRNAKENFKPVNVADVLAKVAAMPISEWNFKTDSATRHIGPMAQDFQKSFGLGTDDKSIATVDADGVALAAIQGLNQKLEAKEKELAAMKERLEKLERLIVENNGGLK